jgi:hypothetical protein
MMSNDLLGNICLKGKCFVNPGSKALLPVQPLEASRYETDFRAY